MARAALVHEPRTRDEAQEARAHLVRVRVRVRVGVGVGARVRVRVRVRVGDVAPVLEVEALGQIEVALDGRALPLAP